MRLNAGRFSGDTLFGLGARLFDTPRRPHEGPLELAAQHARNRAHKEEQGSEPCKAVNGQTLTKQASLHELDEHSPRLVETNSTLIVTSTNLLATSAALAKTYQNLAETGPKLAETSPRLIGTKWKMGETNPRLVEQVANFGRTCTYLVDRGPNSAGRSRTNGGASSPILVERNSSLVDIALTIVETDLSSEVSKCRRPAWHVGVWFAVQGDGPAPMGKDRATLLGVTRKPPA